MILAMVRLTKKKDGKVLEMSEKKWKRELKKLPPLATAYAVEKFQKEIKSFKFIAWVHPKRGGDDYQVEVDQPANSLEEATASLESWLKKVSDVHDDYQVVPS